MSPDLIKAKKALAGNTCVLYRDGELTVSQKTGIRPLLEWLSETPAPFRESCAADKVVGKAAALLFVYGGVKELYAAVISEPAVAVLEKAGIPFEFDCLVPRITNRDGTGLCPMESQVMDIDSPEEAYVRLSAVIKI